jgi:hypothetical protein
VERRFDANGVSIDVLEPEAISDLMDTSPAGRPFNEVARLASQIEVRAPEGMRIELASIAFSDLVRLERSLRELGLETVNGSCELPAGWPTVVVSAVLRAKGRNAPGNALVS